MMTESSVESIVRELRALEDSATSCLDEALQSASPAETVESVRVRFLGKKGEVSRILKSMGKIPKDDRPMVGQAANDVRDSIESAIGSAREKVAEQALQRELSVKTDVTLPGRTVETGRRHPVSITCDEIVSVFATMGFEVAAGPEIEGDFYNFEALNIPQEHPARDMQDTFYLEGGSPRHALLEDGKKGPEPGEVLLRTHTSPVQVRVMLGRKPPVRVICPGKVYRRDSDLTHTPMFHQVEGLWVDRNVTMADLKGTLQLFAKLFFGPDTRIRLRPSYFQFTEPSAEVDLSCTLCAGTGILPEMNSGDSDPEKDQSDSVCKTCSGTGWLEILGAGMVDPAVFEAAGYDPAEWSGFAFGMGIDRAAMLRYRIDDLRMLFENDIRFLQQFP